MVEGIELRNTVKEADVFDAQKAISQRTEWQDRWDSFGVVDLGTSTLICCSNSGDPVGLSFLL